MKDIRRETLWVSVIELPIKILSYGICAGVFAFGAIIIVDGGWEPAIRKYAAFFSFFFFGLGWGIVSGIQHYLFAKKLYGEQWKEEEY